MKFKFVRFPRYLHRTKMARVILVAVLADIVSNSTVYRLE